MVLPIVLLLAAPIDDLARLFDYDRTAPLAYEQARISTRDGVSVFDVSYASPRGGRVRAYLVAPEAKGPHAGVVWQHGGNQDRNWFLPDAIRLAGMGVVSLLLDAPDQRPESMQRKDSPKNDMERAREGMIQVAVDARRSFDVLAARPDVDPKRIGYCGLSFGAMLGADIAGVDKRFRTFVLIAGVVGFTNHYSTSPHPYIKRMRESMPKADFQRLLEAIGPLDAKHYLPHASVPILFQAARFDIGVPESDSKEFFAAAPQPKELKWYDTGHMINDPQAMSDRIAWLADHLKP